LFVDGEEVADTDTVNTGAVYSGKNLSNSLKIDSFSDVRVKAGESVKVKVEAEVEAYSGVQDLPSFRLYIM
jgi:hypothetical protein